MPASHRYGYVLFLYNPHTDPAVKGATLNGILIFLIMVSSVTFVIAQSKMQGCMTDTISKQIESVGDPDVSAVVPPDAEGAMDLCMYAWSMPAALSLTASVWAAAFLGSILSNRLLAESSANISAHYEPDTRKLVLRFNKPTIVRKSQRMVLLYHHADGMATTVPGRQCGDSGLALTFATDVKKPPTLMELVICSGAMHPAGFPESDVCTDGRPIHVDVDILLCDTSG